MGLKIATTVAFIIGFGLMLGWPLILGKRPPRGASRGDLLAYTQRSAAYVGALLFCIVGTGTGSLLIVRRARAEYRERSVANMKRLVGDAEDSEGD